MTSVRQASRLDKNDQAVDAMLGDDVDFGRYVVALWRRIWLIVLVGACCAAATALALTIFRASSYRASSMLAVSGSKVGEQAAPSVSAAYFRPLIESYTLAASVVEELQLGGEPLSMTPESFLSALSVEEVRGSNLLRIDVTLRAPELAAKAANRVAEMAVESARRLSQNEAVQARDDIQVELDQSRNRLKEAAERLQSFKSAAQIELTKEDVDAMLWERGRLPALQLEIAALEGRLAKSEQELASRQRIDSLTRSIVGDEALALAAKTGLSGSGLGLQLQSQEVNEVYESVEETVTEARAELAALQKRRALLIDVLKLDGSRQDKLSELYRKEAELARLQVEYSVAEKSYTEIAARYDVARLQVAARSSQLQLIDRAIVPSAPTPSHWIRQSLFAFLAGVTLTAIAILLAQVLRDLLNRTPAI
jgi:uncharacterized protein involved in exopolysaccharide biosynthesis